MRFPLACALAFVTAVTASAAAPVPEARGALQVVVNFQASKMLNEFPPDERPRLRSEFAERVLAVLFDEQFQLRHWQFVLAEPGISAPFLEVLVSHVGPAVAVDIKLIPHFQRAECVHQWTPDNKPWRTSSSVYDDPYGPVAVTVDSMVKYLTGILMQNNADVRDCLISAAPIASSSHWTSTGTLVVPLPHSQHYPILATAGFGLRVICEGPCRYEKPWLESAVLRDPEAYPPNKPKLFDAVAAEPLRRHCGIEPPADFQQLTRNEIDTLSPGEVFLLRLTGPRSTGTDLPADVPQRLPRRP